MKKLLNVRIRSHAGYRTIQHSVGKVVQAEVVAGRRNINLFYVESKELRRVGCPLAVGQPYCFLSRDVELV